MTFGDDERLEAEAPKGRVNLPKEESPDFRVGACQTPSERKVVLPRLGSLAPLLRFRTAPKRPHVLQAVGQLRDELVGIRTPEAGMIPRVAFLLRPEARIIFPRLGKHLNNGGNPLAEVEFDILKRQHEAIFEDVVKQAGDDELDVSNTELDDEDERDGADMFEVARASLAGLGPMPVLGPTIGAIQQHPLCGRNLEV